ncbi:BREX system ATP-binding protein BrxD [Candidatus Neomicrothrix sp.]|uniref:BREX system ATP-binding protein BrxD n=1 Tax=Candidatus Neomicrothrix sp. TaxID=2719034 RepID=UPI0025BC1AA5|nr:BREX system ATP-binding protein BrxD [Candidatus Microthrix sp.]
MAALRRGTVPARGSTCWPSALTGWGHHRRGGGPRHRGSGAFKALRGEWGSGKTFAARWIADRARRANFVTSEIQISETETPLHHLQTVYRRLVERLAVGDGESGAFRSLIDGWFFVLEEDVLAGGEVNEADAETLAKAADTLMEARLAEVSRANPTFAAVLRAYRVALRSGDLAGAEGLIAWLGGQPNVAANVKRLAGVKGDIDHAGALTFLQGLLTVIRDSGHGGLLVVIDEVETLQRVRTDTRERSLNALRQLIDETDGGRFPGLYLLITGTPAFFDGPQGVQRLAPLAQRLTTDFGGVGFDLLHPVLQHHIVNSLGWRDLRPLQRDAVAPIMAGEHVLALAPTAGGKTEAAMFPVLSQILTEPRRGLSTLYLCPLRALLNNLHPRLETYGAFCGLSVGLRHGDTSSAARRALIDAPPEVLLTTPESLESMLISTKTDHRRLFANLRTVIVDECTPSAATIGSWHLLGVLERLGDLAVARSSIGLSATVGDPARCFELVGRLVHAPAG